jgi:hypothetical protein
VYAGCSACIDAVDALLGRTLAPTARCCRGEQDGAVPRRRWTWTTVALREDETGAPLEGWKRSDEEIPASPANVTAGPRQSSGRASQRFSRLADLGDRPWLCPRRGMVRVQRTEPDLGGTHGEAAHHLGRLARDHHQRGVLRAPAKKYVSDIEDIVAGLRRPQLR